MQTIAIEATQKYIPEFKAIEVRSCIINNEWKTKNAIGIPLDKTIIMTSIDRIIKKYTVDKSTIFAVPSSVIFFFSNFREKITASKTEIKSTANSNAPKKNRNLTFSLNKLRAFVLSKAKNKIANNAHFAKITSTKLIVAYIKEIFLLINII